MTQFVVTKFHQDINGNFRDVGEMLDLTDELAAPYRKRGQLMTPEEWAAKKMRDAEKAKTATYEFHHYERP